MGYRRLNQLLFLCGVAGILLQVIGYANGNYSLGFMDGFLVGVAMMALVFADYSDLI